MTFISLLSRPIIDVGRLLIVYTIHKLEFLFIEHKLNEVISQDSSSLAVKDTGVRYGGP